MRDGRDIVEVGGERRSVSHAPEDRGSGRPKRFLSVWFRCCHTYGRLNRNKDATAFEGRCPKCGAAVRALIGTDGTSRRVFEAR